MFHAEQREFEMRKTVNLADRAAAMEALKQLYGQEPRNGDDSKADSDRKSGTESPREVDKDPA